jgi:DNA-binding transcriptional regulator YiaG
MTTTEFRDTLTALGLSQVGAARLLGVDGRTVRRWIKGDREIPAPAARFLIYLVAAEISPAEVITRLYQQTLPDA